jgi:hypothetical protein
MKRLSNARPTWHPPPPREIIAAAWKKSQVLRHIPGAFGQSPVAQMDNVVVSFHATLKHLSVIRNVPVQCFDRGSRVRVISHCIVPPPKPHCSPVSCSCCTTQPPLSQEMARNLGTLRTRNSLYVCLGSELSHDGVALTGAGFAGYTLEIGPMFVSGNVRPLLGDRRGFSAGAVLSRTESWNQGRVEAELPERRSELWRSDSDSYARYRLHVLGDPRKGMAACCWYLISRCGGTLNHHDRYRNRVEGGMHTPGRCHEQGMQKIHRCIAGQF